MYRKSRFRPTLCSLEDRCVPATFTVQNLLNNGADSLRNAIIQANGSAGADTIAFKSGLSGTIVLTGGDIAITEAVTIQGPGAKVITVQGGGVGRIFTTKNAPAGSIIAFKGLTLTGGNDAGGGAIMGDDQDLFISECAISGNSATGSGGGVYLQGNGRLSVFNSTVSGNNATVDGGGASVNGASAEMYVYNSTVSGNTAGGDGGGLYCDMGNGNALFVYNSTITANQANRGGGFALGVGAGVIATLDACLVSNNSAPTGPDLFGGSINMSYSALGSKSGVAGFGADSTTLDLLGKNFKLGPLTDNGGNVLSHKPGLDSPVRDRSANYAGANTDVRGIGFPREINGLVDCGAVECDPLFVVKNDKDFGPDSLRQQIEDANIFAGTNVITFDAVAFATTDGVITLSKELTVLDALAIVGPGADQLTITTNLKGRAINYSTSPIFAEMTLQNLTIAQCQATEGGGILAEDENLHLVGVALRDNVATTGKGGGILINTGGDLEVTNSTLSGNSSFERGGAICFASSGTSFKMLNSTIANNSAIYGGAISLDGTFSQFSITNSTIAYNKATGLGITAGGIQIASVSKSTVALESSIVAGNLGSGGQPDFSMTSDPIVSAIRSAIGSSAGITTFNADATTTSLLGQDFKLGLLANNGGPMQTILPTTGISPLINAGSNPTSAVNDQRGVGYGRLRGTAVDIGATEYPQSFIVTNTQSIGVGSLRQAVTDADSFTGEDTIVFDASIFSSPATITLTGAIAIDEAVSIVGRGANLTTIDAGKNGRLFNTAFASAGSKVVFSALRMINGSVTGAGGGILIGDENVFLVACEISDSTATTIGGGISVNGGNLTIVDSTIAGNTSSGGNGGGIDFMGAGNLIIRNSTISGNSASGNNGGGLCLDNHTGETSITNSTFALNSAFVGGGIGRVAGTGVINLESCLVSENSAASGHDIATSGTLDAKTSLLGKVAATTINKDATTTNLLGAYSGINVLTYSGGSTRIHPLQGGSQAIGKGSNPANLTYDQRGFAYPRTNQQTIDCGAVEYSPPVMFVNYQVNDGTPQRSSVTLISLAFDTTVTFAGNPVAAFELNRVSPLPLAPVALAASVDNTFGYTIVTLTFTGGSVDGSSLADGRYNLLIKANQFLGPGFDSNADGKPGDSHTIIGSPSNGLFRLFGDADGNGTVNAADFAVFRGAFGLSGPSIFDFNNDNQTNASDFAQFRARFGLLI